VTPDLSLVIPLRDEEPNVRPLHHEVTGVLAAMGGSYEVIYIEDGSVDGTWAALTDIQRQDAHVRAVRFTRNFGQTAAFAAGFALARAPFIVTSDGDLQNDPADIPRLMALARTHDIVCGWRKDRKDNSLTRRLPSVIANWLLGAVSGVRLHDTGCSLKVFRAEVVKPLKLKAGMHRYLPVLASQLGGRVAESVVNHRPRRYGRSKYGLSRTFVVIADLIRLRQLMRSAVDPAAALTPYEIAALLEPPERPGLRREG
jgi:glycosyltransferase involved in cell wall biosynthesis